MALNTTFARSLEKAPQQLREVAAAAWAFGKAAAAMDQQVEPHQEIFDAIATFLLDQGTQLASAQSVSNIAWAFAKARISHPQALHELAVAASRLMPTFRDQNVANTVWAYATLALDEEELFAAALQRADHTLYEDEFKNHVRISRRVKVIHFYQVYTAYCFCLDNLPGVVVLLSERLRADLARILGSPILSFCPFIVWVS